jgi:hypothetical protein
MAFVVALVTSPDIASRLAAQSGSATVAGDWLIAYDRVSTPLTVKLDGTSVNGTYNGQAITGEFAKGTLTFARPDDWIWWQNHAIGNPDAKEMYQTVHSATLNVDGRLHGTSDTYVRGTGMAKRSSWVAERAKSR